MSVSFVDGPAAGVALELSRAPLLLRVVEARGVATDRWDALDRLDDQPRPEERIYVYRRRGAPMTGFIDGTKYRGQFLAATYVLFEEQPATDAEARTTEAWRAWAESKRHLFR